MHLFITSFILFLILNIFENLIHYNIHIHSNDNNVKINMSTQRNWMRIIITMFVFAFYKDFLSYYL
jgi:hypothetical protein